MPRCYVVPGLAGSELFRDAALTRLLWVSYTQLLLSGVGPLRLGPDGVSPGPPDGVPLYAGAPLPDYYEQATVQLAAALGPHGYDTFTHGYDWRLSTRITGPQLAARLRTEVSPADPCSLVCHSLGGLVARLAWADLVRTGETALVRRIITIGTPHWGSYAAVRLWSLDSEVSSQISFLSWLTATYYTVPVAIAAGLIWTPTRIAALASTWPSLYETLPSLLAPDAGSDPGRASIYMGQWPADRGVRADLLADAVNVFQPLMADVSTQPPSWVMTTVAGIGESTVGALVAPWLLGSARAYRVAGDGDTTVQRSSALLDNSAQYTIGGCHGDLPEIAAGLPAAAQAVLDPRGPPGPAPPPVAVPGSTPYERHGPPFPGPFGPPLDP